MSNPPPTPGTQIGHFQILEPLGQGGMGTVFKAQDLRLDRVVALKFVAPELVDDATTVKRFEREARLASRLLHPNVATIFEFDHDAGRHFIVMEYVAGETARRRISGQPLPPEDLTRLALGTARGLAEAHRNGVLHRDIKASNVVFADNGTVKILDFGLAKAVAPPLSDPTFGDRPTEADTSTGSVPGTMGYTSPEVLRGGEPLPASDVFSLGVLLYEAACGQMPFRGATPALVIDAVLNQKTAAPSTRNPALDPSWDRIILKCLNKDPAARFVSAVQLLEAIESDSTTASRVTAAPPRRRGRHAVAALLLLVLLFAWYALMTQRSTRAPVQPSVRLPPRLVVLPFEHSGPDSEARFLTEGLAEEIAGRLAEIGDLRVVSPLSAGSYRGRQATARQLREELDVDYALVGKVSQDGVQVVVQVHLTDCRTELTEWNQRLARTLSAPDIFKVQEEIALSVIDSLRLELSPAQQASLAAPPTASGRAYQQYQQGRALLALFNREETRRAIRAFESAVELDPEFAQAHASLAEGYFHLAAFGWMSPAEAYVLAEKHSKTALSLDDRISEAHHVLANVYSMVYRDAQRAEKEYRKSIALKGNNVVARSWLAMEYMYQGRFAEAEAEMESAAASDPHSPFVAAVYGGVKYMSGDYLNAEVQAEKAIRLNPNYVLAYLVGGTVRVLLDRPAEARAILEAGLQRRDGPTWALVHPRMEGMLALCARREGRDQEFLKRRADLEAGYDANHLYAYPMAILESAHGDKSSALGWLERAVQQHAFGWQEIRYDPFLAVLRDEAAFQTLLQSLPFQVAPSDAR